MSDKYTGSTVIMFLRVTADLFNCWQLRALRELERYQPFFCSLPQVEVRLLFPEDLSYLFEGVFLCFHIKIVLDTCGTRIRSTIGHFLVLWGLLSAKVRGHLLKILILERDARFDNFLLFSWLTQLHQDLLWTLFPCSLISGEYMML